MSQNLQLRMNIGLLVLCRERLRLVEKLVERMSQLSPGLVHSPSFNTNEIPAAWQPCGPRADQFTNLASKAVTDNRRPDTSRRGECHPDPTGGGIKGNPQGQ